MKLTTGLCALRTPHPCKSLILILLLSGFSFADSLSVEKLLEKTDLSAGDNVQVLLKFSNPFGQPIPMKIVDKNIIGGNGLDVQCLEFNLPADRSQTIGYEPIPSFQPGSFTLDKAQITYTNPQTGKEETVYSNSFDITLKSSGTQGTQQGITTIYQCGGTNVRSTSFTSSGQQPQPPPQSQEQQQTQQTQDKVQGMQQQNMQDMNSVKQQMEQQQKQENELKDKIEQNPDFKKIQDELQKQGYSKKQSQITPEQSQNSNSQPQSQNSQSQQNPNQQNQKAQPQSQEQQQNQQGSQPNSPSQNPSASFKYDFQKPTGENATIQGRVEQGNLTQISKWSAEDAKALSDEITQDPKFQQLSQSLQKQGFNQTSQQIAPPSGNLSQFTYSFSNLNETRNITGTATPQGNITSIKIEQPEKKSDTYFWLFLLLLLMIAYFLYLKSRKKLISELPPVNEARINYRKEALSMITAAEQLFSQNKIKDAFSLLSEAVRFYFKHKVVSDKKELSTADLLAHLKQYDRNKVKPAQACLNLCDLVVFAKFAPDAEDFSHTAALAKKLVSK